MWWHFSARTDGRTDGHVETNTPPFRSEDLGRCKISIWLVYGTCLYSHIHVDMSIKEYNHLQSAHYAPIQVYQGTILSRMLLLAICEKSKTSIFFKLEKLFSKNIKTWLFLSPRPLKWGIICLCLKYSKKF